MLSFFADDIFDHRRSGALLGLALLLVRDLSVDLLDGLPHDMVGDLELLLQNVLEEGRRVGASSLG